jgi:hypothetical protein
MWNWTRMGARVVITPGSISPAAFSHPVLAALKVPPQPVTAKESKGDSAAVPGSENAPKNQANVTPALPEPKVGLRLTIGQADDARPLAETLDARSAPPTQTADASGTVPKPASMSDAAPAGQAMSAAADPAVSDRHNSSPPAAPAGFSRDGAEPSAAKASGTTLPDARVASEASAKSEPNPASDREIKPEGSSAQTNGRAAPLEAQDPKTTVEKSVEKPADSVPPEVAKPTSTSSQSADDSQPTPKADPTSLIKRSGQIAIFVSRKDSKLYVRQNLSPLFDLPVTIAADERPLGTHIFTAQVDHRDANVLHWSVVSLPAPVRHAEWRHQEGHSARGRKAARPPAIPAKAQPLPDGPAEALDRLNLPAEAMARIFESISTGGSIIVSDQGIDASETGEGTDFIVSLR